MLKNANQIFTIDSQSEMVKRHRPVHPINLRNRFLKRLFDTALALVGLATLWWLILITYVLATIDTKRNGFFTQQRVGKDGKLFYTVKIRTMRDIPTITTTTTTARDPRITKLGSFLRKSKLDELPQLLNVLLGQMSFVGPRPDVPGFADQLAGEDRVVLAVRPGITGPATLAFRNEEKLLASQSDPERYNREVIYPEKVRINRDYVTNYRFTNDIRYIIKTVIDL
jgi:lipopolysaccharide/colanic/teichoic acid biosynthesis glycosyltransferase